MSARTAPGQRALPLLACSVAFALVYMTCNRLTHGRSDIGLAVFAWERVIPFVPWTIVPYLSLFGAFVLSFLVTRPRAPIGCHVLALAVDLLLSATCFLIVPLRFAFERPVPDGFWGPPFELLAAVDMPYNRAPSLHISMAFIVWRRLADGLSGWKRAAIALWTASIGVSVLTTYQHHVIDVAAGLSVGGVSLWLAQWLFLRRQRASSSGPG